MASQDNALQLITTSIIDTLHQHPGAALLWLADEHINIDDLSYIPSHHRTQITVLSNRFNIYQNANNIGYKHSYFNDFDFSALATSFDYIYLRIPKEKLLCQHLLSQAPQKLSATGKFIFSGSKQEGLKSHLKFLAELGFKALPQSKKQAAKLLAISFSDIAPPPINAYTDFSPLKYDKLKLLSKPGQYGWQKIDAGSQLLIETFDSIYKQYQPKSFLDLGCGYGLLTIASAPYTLVRTATDNNAAALASCERNCVSNNIACDVIADDIAKNNRNTYDWIACNPPFHQGFQTSPQLIIDFLSQTRRLLSNKGVATFVSNEFIPLQREAKNLFSHVELLSSKQGFNIHLLKNI